MRYEQKKCECCGVVFAMGYTEAGKPNSKHLRCNHCRMHCNSSPLLYGGIQHTVKNFELLEKPNK